jgi:hypothetical protein
MADSSNVYDLNDFRLQKQKGDNLTDAEISKIVLDWYKNEGIPENSLEKQVDLCQQSQELLEYMM